ncbi:hypothetical protein BJF93_08015 [Xaviernesmea oryzae]|uniref:Type II secretion system protein H n=1 Tax=Xaviernesmea oryzae TaxID=464029 RepID=A0A1Q9AW88_9HYPH|nr:prepilin-type N-terminal cleavage/methylation domain-containing protein [Xaviernesmea oryzae]OLP59706.1 hypothetical protein BJF93_08015 [Xaviernesmea oryzae]SEM35656.1 prepilin-type N-terminal cleavage/methylation domain-containing protein [Xaviernesmea oryzae]
MTAVSGSKQVSRVKDGGFTLIEVLAVLAVLALGLAVALPNFRQLLQPSPRAVGQRIAAMLRTAHLAAISSNVTQTITFDLAAKLIRDERSRAQIIVPSPMSISLTYGSTGREPSAAGTIMFYAQGTSSGGEVRLTGDAGDKSTISVDWLTAKISIKQDDEQ